MIVQIAGIVDVETALMCVECGVDIVGLLVGQMHSSFEFISKEDARKIKLALPKHIKTTLITHLEDAKQIIEIAEYIGVDYIQLHSQIKESEVSKIRKALKNVGLIRVIHVSSDGKILTDYKNFKYADFYFTDSINFETNQVGGTGLTHNLETDKFLVKNLDKPVFIAGGLIPENVGNAVEFCKPYGVDVNSGVRGKNGVKDKKKVLEFVKNAKKFG